MVSSNIFNPVVTFVKAGGLMGLIEVWMELKIPDYWGSPIGQPNSPVRPRVDARIKVPDREHYVWSTPSEGSDPRVDYSDDWTWTVWEDEEDGPYDETLDMPPQFVFDASDLVVAGEFRTYPQGVTGGNVSDMTQGGATNFLINWEKVAKAEFFDLPPETPMSEWPPLEIEIFGASDARSLKIHTVRTTFKLLNTKLLSDLTRNDPAWLELEFDPELVIEESEPVNATFDAFYSFLDTPDNYDDARELVGTLIYRWVLDPEADPPEEKIEFLTPGA